MSASVVRTVDVLYVAMCRHQVLAAAAAAPTSCKAAKELGQLPRQFIMDGFCVYVSKPLEVQRLQAATNHRMEADVSAISSTGLQSAVLQLSVQVPRHLAL